MSAAEKTIQDYKQKFAQNSRQESPSGDEQFNVSRDMQSPVTINFDTGQDERSFPYTYLQDFGFNKGAIDLQFSTGNVCIKGKNLKPLYQSIKRYRISEVTVSKINHTSNDQSVQDNLEQASLDHPVIDEIIINLHREKNT